MFGRCGKIIDILCQPPHLKKPLVRRDYLVVQIRGNDTVSRRLERRCQKRKIFGEGVLGEFAFGYVAVDAQNCRFPLKFDQRSVYKDVDRRSVLSKLNAFKGVCSPVAQQRLDLGLTMVRILRNVPQTAAYKFVTRSE